MLPSHDHYASASAISDYLQSTLRKVPGLTDLHRMAMLLIAEHAPESAHILVVGAGGGMETRALADSQPGWRFTGVDPARPMLDLAKKTLAPFLDRVQLIEGFVDNAPQGPFDGATCLLTLHHIDQSERLRTLRKIRRRLRPGAALVIVEHSAFGRNPERWMTRSIAFGDRAGIDWQKAAATARLMMERLPLTTPAVEEGLLEEAGFESVELFYAAFSFRGWLAIASKSSPSNDG